MKKLMIFSALCLAVAIWAQSNKNYIQNKEGSDRGLYEKIERDTSDHTGQVIRNLYKDKLDSLRRHEQKIHRHLWDKLNEGLTAIDPVEKSYQFLEMHKDILNLDNPRQELILRRDKNYDIKGGVHVFFDQFFNGIKVRNSGYSFHFKSDGKLYDISGHIYPDAKKIDTTPTVTQEEAKQIAINDPRSKGVGIEKAKKAELEIILHKDKFYLTWNVLVACLEQIIISSNFFIDAKTGEILEETTNMRF